MRSVFKISDPYILCATRDDLLPNVNLTGIVVSQNWTQPPVVYQYYDIRAGI